MSLRRSPRNRTPLLATSPQGQLSERTPVDSGRRSATAGSSGAPRPSSRSTNSRKLTPSMVNVSQYAITSSKAPNNRQSPSKRASSSTKRPSPSKETVGSTKKRAKTARNQIPTHRKTPIMEHVAIMRARIKENSNIKSLLIDGARYKRMTWYTIPLESHFGLEEEACILYRDKKTLPVDHPKHRDILMEELTKIKPTDPQIYEQDNVTLHRFISDRLARKVDFDTESFREQIDLLDLIQVWREEAMEEVCPRAAEAGGTSMQSPVTPMDQAQATVLSEISAPAASSFATTLEVITTLAISQSQTVEMQKTMAESQLQTAEMQKTMAESQLKTEKALQDMARQVGSHESQLQNHHERITTLENSTAKWYEEMKEQLSRERQQASTPSNLFQDEASIVDLDDITTEKENYLMDQFDSLLSNDADLSSFTDVRRRMLENVRSQDLKSLAKTDFIESRFILLDGAAPSKIAELESFEILVQALKNCFLVIQIPESHSAIYVTDYDCHDEFTASEFLPTVGGVQNEFVVTFRKSCLIFSPSPEAATDTLGALLKLCSKSGARDIEIESGWVDQNENGTSVSLPLQTTPLEGCNPFDLYLKHAIVSPDQQKTLVASCHSVVMDSSSFSGGGVALAQALATEEQTMPLCKIDCRCSIPFSDEALRSLIKDTKSVKIRIEDREKQLDQMPQALAEIASLTQIALMEGTKVENIEFHYTAVMTGKLKSSLKKAVEQCDSQVLQKIQEEENFELPIRITGDCFATLSEKKLKKLSDLVKTWAKEAAQASATTEGAK